MYYGPDMMEKAGITIASLDDKESSLILAIPLSCFNVLGTIICMCLIDKLGRRYLILRTTPFVALSWIIAAIGQSFTGVNQSDTT